MVGTVGTVHTVCSDGASQQASKQAKATFCRRHQYRDDSAGQGKGRAVQLGQAGKQADRRQGHTVGHVCRVLFFFFFLSLHTVGNQS